MDTKLVLFLIAAFCINGLNSKSTNHFNHAKKSKSSNLLSKDLDSSSSIANGQNGPYCQSLMAFFVGDLQNKKNPKKDVAVFFQARLSIDQEKEKIHVQADKWNELYSKSENVELDFYDGENREWCDIYDDSCSIPLAKHATTFTLDLNTASGNYFHLLNFNYFNNSFGLNNAIGQCSKSQVNDSDHTPDLTQLDYCVCCDDYTPDKSLACPYDNWKDETTENPASTTTASPTEGLQCKSLVGYYNGTFQNVYKPTENISVEFQTHIRSNNMERVFYLSIDHWNEQKSNSSDFQLSAKNYEAIAECEINNSDCSIPYVREEVNPLVFYLQHFDENHIWSNEYDFLAFPIFFNNTLTLTNTIGECTKHQVQERNNYAPKTSYYEYCLCCGSDYNPDPALGCPKNPWA